MAQLNVFLSENGQSAIGDKKWSTRSGGAVEFATSLRDDLAEAERVSLQLHEDNVESVLQLLDRVDERFTQLASSGLESVSKPRTSR